MSDDRSHPNGAPVWASLEGPAEKHLALRVSPAAERAIRNGHPWLFDSAIQRQSREGRAGDLAVIFDRKGRFLAVGLFDPCSPIRVRILHQGSPTPIDLAWFRQRLLAAAALRGRLEADPKTSGYRLVHGENDGLPGVVVDRYGLTQVVKLYSSAWVRLLPPLLEALSAAVPTGRLVLRLSQQAQQCQPALQGLRDGMILSGTELAGPVLFQENGLKFEAAVMSGQKTGFFLDQRDNRARVEQLAGGKRVLNAFAYTGAFSLYAARGGARSVVSLDISQQALAGAARNFSLNEQIAGVVRAEHEMLSGDAFNVLHHLRHNRRRFDLVIVDPPSFARRQADVSRALGAYDRLVRLALGVLQAGGTLVMASCSSRVTAEAFYQRVHEAARAVNRPLQELMRTGHPHDHPVSFKEGAYLKCLFAIAA